MFQAEWKTATYLNFTNTQDLVQENSFRQAPPNTDTIPSFAQARPHLPQPYWQGHDDAIACWWKVWELGWHNIKPTTAENGFIAPYIDTAFNGNLFLWDSVFALMFARYGRRQFNFQQTLDNFYAKQRGDGFICRELRPEPNGDMFHPHDPASTGPNVFAWSEWEDYQNTGDLERLGRVFIPILAYHRWLRTYRTWPDGSYFHSGLASGMDNQPIDGSGDPVQTEHRHLSRIDATAQALLSAQMLCNIAAALNRSDLTQPEQQEVIHLTQLLNEKSWDDATNFYHHWHAISGRTPTKSVGAFWVLLTNIVPSSTLPKFLSSLSDSTTFNRPHRIPSLAHDDPSYSPNGSYWRGGVWPPTNYMTLRGLTLTNQHDLAYEIACNHHNNAVQVFKDTGTVWEFYAPEKISYGLRHDGKTAVTDFVGWSGLAPIALLLEYRFGLRPDAPNNHLIWDIREESAFGVTNYPFGSDGLLDLHYTPTLNNATQPDINIQSNIPLQLHIHWRGNQYTHHITAG